MQKKLLQSIKILILVLVFSFGAFYLHAAGVWFSPSYVPILGNISAPINTTTAPQAMGNILVGSLFNVDGTISTDSLYVTNGTILRSGVKLLQFATGGTKKAVCRDAASHSVIDCPVLNTKVLTVNKAGPGTSSNSVISSLNGINCGATCTYNFASGSSFYLVATPASGYTFSSWSGCSSTSGTLPNQTCNVNLNANTTVTATFSNSGIPIVSSTASVTSINQNGAISGGTITSNGGSSVTARGVAWVASPASPTTANSKTSDGIGNGSFISSITGLTAGTTYNVKAYATNSAGTGYGPQVSFSSSPGIPTLSTNTITAIAQTTATGGGSIVSDGGSPITQKGVVWNTYQMPTTANSKTTNGSGSASFVSNLTGLTSATVYYVRAYATNSAGTAYGPQQTFTTLQIQCGSNKVVAGYCWYLNPTQNQNCTTYCASRGGCINASLTYAQETQVCGVLGMGGIAGGANSITPNTGGGVCYVYGTVSNVGPFSHTTCSQSQAWRQNACSCNQ